MNTQQAPYNDSNVGGGERYCACVTCALGAGNDRLQHVTEYAQNSNKYHSAQHSTNSTSHHSAAQHRHSTAQHSTAQHTRLIPTPSPTTAQPAGGKGAHNGCQPDVLCGHTELRSDALVAWSLSCSACSFNTILIFSITAFPLS